MTEQTTTALWFCSLAGSSTEVPKWPRSPVSKNLLSTNTCYPLPKWDYPLSSRYLNASSWCQCLLRCVCQTGDWEDFKDPQTEHHQLSQEIEIVPWTPLVTQEEPNQKTLFAPKAQKIFLSCFHRKEKSSQTPNHHGVGWIQLHLSKLWQRSVINKTLTVCFCSS